MKKVAKSMDNTKNKVSGGIKEAVGKVANNEHLERKGKKQSSKADSKR